MTLLFEPLNAERILSAIDASNKSKLKKIEILELIDSTNQYLLDQAKQGLSGWVCLAEHQTAARGRRGRAWFSVRGSSILCSLLWRFPKELLDVSGLSIAVGVMLVRALKKQNVQTDFQLKWPNDILYAGRKLAGILLEKRGENIVIGFGLNVNLPRPLAADRIDLAEIAGQSIVERNDLTGLILNELLSGLTLYQTQGLTAFINEWTQYDFLAGKEVIVHTSEKKIVGTAQGISDRGELLVLDETQTMQRFHYGDVSVRQCLP
jgi:BirA family biotin operon repressor/biotin-[acetyl-CoA-carboxylase] ligase